MGSFGCTITSASCLIIPNSVRKLNKSKCHKTYTKHLLVEMCYWLLWWYANLFVRITICHVPGNWWYEHENMLMLYSSPVRGEFQTKATISNHNLIITYHHCGLNVWHATLCVQHVNRENYQVAPSLHLFTYLGYACSFLLIATINNPISCSWSVSILNIDEYCTSMCFPRKKPNPLHQSNYVFCNHLMLLCWGPCSKAAWVRACDIQPSKSVHVLGGTSNNLGNSLDCSPLPRMPGKPPGLHL